MLTGIDLKQTVLDVIDNLLEENRANSKLSMIYRRARKSVSNEPFVRSVQELLKVKYLGPKLVQKIERDLIKLDPSVKSLSQSPPISSNVSTNANPADESLSSQSTRTTNKKYIPRYRSGGYAILIALELSPNTFSNKSEIINRGTPYCEHSFTDPGYNSWSSISNLLKHELVVKEANLYALTEKGREIARIFVSQMQGVLQRPAENDSQGNASSNTVVAVTSQILKKGTFDIFLVLDSREQKSRTERTYFQSQLKALNVPTITLPLPISDMCWIAEHQITKCKYVIGWLIERKCNDDLLSSIKDTRYTEQKQRLKQSGRKVVYLVEGFNPNNCNALESKSMKTSLVETMILNDFELKLTYDARDTVNYLAASTFLLQQLYNKDLTIEQDLDTVNCYNSDTCTPFDTFIYKTSKTTNMTALELWQRQLLTIRGLSKPKVKILTQHYPTMISLLEALSDKTVDEQVDLIAKLGNVGQVFGKQLCKTLVDYFTAP